MPARVLETAWLPPGRKVFRVILHWSAGGYRPSLLDRGHYHFLIDGDGEAHPGLRGPGLYLPHTRLLNTGSVGLSLCGMLGAQEQPRVPGPAPITKLQWERGIQAAAEILAAYDLALTERTLLCHSEVERVYGITQHGKWDVDWLPFAGELSPSQIHQQLRQKCAWYLQEYHGRR
ncbi:MAG TPA: N-acetylmuramoyl-L-alanine amidase [Armatimonadota bacterium]|nr:N-acetylmuramoyl-L-alanine amidase [Armatimonadota bacterium]